MRVRARDWEFTPTRLLVGALLIAATLSALSLLFNHAIDYDPEGWIVYAREVFGQSPLNTDGFPAWKPLPVVLIGPLTLITKGEGDVYYWLFITRAASVLTVFATATLAYRFGGRVAALLAGAMVILSPWWAIDGAIGRDSSISAALFLGAFLVHYRGGYRWTVLCLTGVALLRPEATPLLLVYGIWMWRRHRLSWWLPLMAIALIAFAWLVPTIFHTGLNPAEISKNSGGPDTAINSSFPFLTVIIDAGKQAHELPAALLVLAILALLYRFVLRRAGRFGTLWGRTSEEVVVLLAGIAWVLIVAAETEKGYAGNPRYLVPGVVLFFAAGAVVAVRLAGSSRPALIASVVVCIVGTAALAVEPFKAGVSLIQTRDRQVYDMRQELAIVKCPRMLKANAQNNAYLSQLTGEPLQDSINWHLPSVRFDDNAYYWFVYCPPPA